jgi:hypothetical protein
MNDRYICTKSNPWKPEFGNRSAHPDAVLVTVKNGWGAGESSYDQFKCPHCGLIFDEEVPQ